MKVEVTEAFKLFDSRQIPMGRVLEAIPYFMGYLVTEGEFRGVLMSQRFCKQIPEKTYTEKEYNNVMDLLDKEREKNDRLAQSVHTLINIIYRNTYSGV